MQVHLDLDRDRIADFCRRWKIRELALFGSVLRDDFHEGSDLDVLVTFEDDARVGLFAHVKMEAELGSIVGRKVDLVARRAVERSANWIRRQAILEGAAPYYVAR